MTEPSGFVAGKMKEHKEVNSDARLDEGTKMKACEWRGKKHVVLNSNRPKPLVSHEKDAILEVTSTAICGSDLHIYVGAMPGMKAGQVLGHEFMGVVNDVGLQVKNFKAGDRVVACFDISCGSCFYCNQGLFTSCDETGNNKMAEMTYGHKMGGFYGYTELTGGYDGGQADFVRVPYADNGLLKVPDNLPDNKVLLLSDILPTAWHGNELARVGEGDTVGIWGAGPVGILGAMCAFNRGAKTVIMIDCLDYRLEFAKEKVGGPGKPLHTINFKKHNVKEKLKELVGMNGLDCAIEMVGFHYSASWTSAIEKAMMLESDPAEVLNEIIGVVRKGGRIGIIGAYAGYCNHFNIGAFMEKGLSMAGGQTPVQKYWNMLLKKVEDGELDPSVVITHDMSLDKIEEAYRIFNEKEDNCVKVVLHPEPHTGGVFHARDNKAYHHTANTTEHTTTNKSS